MFSLVTKKPQQIEYAHEYFRSKKIEPFTSKELERHLNSAHHIFERQLFDSIEAELSDKKNRQLIFCYLNTIQ